MRNNLAVLSFLALVPFISVAQEAQIPKQFHGDWGSPGRCGTHHDGVLTIAGDKVNFYESRGRVISVKVLSATEIEVELESTGEGETNRETRLFKLSADGKSITNVMHHGTLTRVRCK